MSLSGMKESLHHPHVVLMLEAICLFGTGLIAGATTYITLIEVPGRAQKPAAYQLENYHEIFPRAARLMKTTGTFLTPLTMLTAVLTKNKTWWIPVVLVGALGPFTVVCITPTNDTLMAAKDGDKVKKELEAWGTLHSVRTYMALLGFAGAVAAIVLE